MKIRIIDQLRDKFPGNWTYDTLNHSWCHEDGWKVRPYSVLTGVNDDSFKTEYKRTDISQIVLHDPLDLFNG